MSWLSDFLSHQGPAGRAINAAANSTEVKDEEVTFIERGVHIAVQNLTAKYAPGATSPTEAEIDTEILKQLGVQP
jgi:hypothetical protein